MDAIIDSLEIDSPYWVTYAYDTGHGVFRGYRRLHYREGPGGDGRYTFTEAGGPVFRLLPVEITAIHEEQA